MKKLIFILFLVPLSCITFAQKKEYLLGHHATSIQFSTLLVGLQANYHYIINPKARFMWLGKVGIGYSPYEIPKTYYNIGIELAYGNKHRVVLGLGGYYDAGYTNSNLISSDLGYLLLGKKHIFFSPVMRIYYDPNCECGPEFNGFDFDLLLLIGWKF